MNNNKHDCHNCKILRDKIAKYELLLKDMNNIMASSGVDDYAFEDIGDMSIIDNYKKINEIHKQDIDMINEQNNLYNYDKLQTNVNKIKSAYSTTSYVLGIGKTVIGFIV